MNTEAASGVGEEQQGRADSQIYMTSAGLPLSIELNWPFHQSTSGADFYVLHGDVRLENGGGLHALVAVQLTLTVRDVLPSLEPSDAEAPVTNALRKETDRKQLEFVKSPKRLPVSFNSRIYDFRRNRWAFHESSDDDVAALLKRKVYWQTKLGGQQVPIADPIDAQYLSTTPDHMLEVATRSFGSALDQRSERDCIAGVDATGRTDRSRDARGTRRLGTKAQLRARIAAHRRARIRQLIQAATVARRNLRGIGAMRSRRRAIG